MTTTSKVFRQTRLLIAIGLGSALIAVASGHWGSVVVVAPIAAFALYWASLHRLEVSERRIVGYNSSGRPRVNCEPKEIVVSAALVGGHYEYTLEHEGTLFPLKRLDPTGHVLASVARVTSPGQWMKVDRPTPVGGTSFATNEIRAEGTRVEVLPQRKSFDLSEVLLVANYALTPHNRHRVFGFQVERMRSHETVVVTPTETVLLHDQMLGYQKLIDFLLARLPEHVPVFLTAGRFLNPAEQERVLSGNTGRPPHPR